MYILAGWKTCVPKMFPFDPHLSERLDVKKSNIALMSNIN